MFGCRSIAGENPGASCAVWVVVFGDPFTANPRRGGRSVLGPSASSWEADPKVICGLRQSVGSGRGSSAMRMGAASSEAKWSWRRTYPLARIWTSMHMMSGSPAWIPLHSICWSTLIGQREASRDRQDRRPKGTPRSCRRWPSSGLETTPSVGRGRHQRMVPPSGRCCLHPGDITKQSEINFRGTCPPRLGDDSRGSLAPVEATAIPRGYDLTLGCSHVPPRQGRRKGLWRSGVQLWSWAGTASGVGMMPDGGLNVCTLSILAAPGNLSRGDP